MKLYQSIFQTSIDDFVTSEDHICIWEFHAQTECEPAELCLVSVDGMGQEVCPKDLWDKVNSEYPDDLHEPEYE
jgi:hypothetical protein